MSVCSGRERARGIIRRWKEEGGRDALAMARRQLSRAHCGAPSGSVDNPEVYKSGARPSLCNVRNWEGYPPYLAWKIEEGSHQGS